MGFAIQCGSCNQQFTVEQETGIVECPHCNTALQLPDRPADPGDVPVAPESAIVKSDSPNLAGAEPPAKPGSGVLTEGITAGLPAAADSGDLSEESHFPGLPGEAPVSDVNMPAIDTGSGTKLAGPDSATALAAFSKTLGDPPPDPDEPTVMDVNLQEDLKNFVPTLQTPAPAPVPEVTEPPKATTAPANVESQPATNEPIATAESAPAQAGISRTIFFAVCGYASAVTIFLAWLLIKGGGLHPLDKLPDVVPKPKGYIIPEDTAMPPGHTLQIGQTARFGHLEITPVKVTRGPVNMVSSGTDEKFATDPVIALHLKIRNVSKKQSFQPFGRRLMMLRGTSDNREKEGANIFLCKADEKKKDGHLIYVYRPDTYRLEGQQLDRLLDPGDEYETFIASNDEGLDKLTGDLIWRVHVRKGYNPKTENGVTTIFEVSFHSDEIKSAGG